MKTTNLLLPIFLFLACSANLKQETATSQTIKTFWLKKIKSSNRISSNNYSDFVIDSKGNSYIACFHSEQRKDYIYLVKINPAGEIVWEMDKPNEGRATSIALDPAGHIWVSGFYHGILDFNEKSDFSPLEKTLFLAQFDSKGICHRLISSQGAAIGFNMHINAQGDLLLSGNCGSKLSIGDQQINRTKGDGDFFFLGIFDGDGHCRSLRPFPTSISNITSDKSGNFYLAGRFNQPFDFDGHKAETNDHYDNDAFLLKLNKDGKTQWFKQFGKKGNARYGYRSEEGFNDLLLNRDRNIVVLATAELPSDDAALVMLEKENSLKTVVLIFDKNGILLHKKTIASAPNGGTSQTLVQTANGHYFLSFSINENSVVEGQKISFADQFKSIVLKYDQEWNLLDLQFPGDGTDATLRVAKPYEKHVHYSGHFRHQFEFGGKKINGEGNRHCLYMLKIE